MGVSAGIPRPTADSEETPNDTGQQTTAKTQAFQDYTLMTSLQHHILNDNIQGDKQKKQIRIIDVTTPPCIKKLSADIQCGDFLEFNVIGNDEYDIFQVYRDGHDYYRIDHGITLLNIKTRTPKKDRCRLLSLALNEDVFETYLYFCVIPSSQRKEVFKNRKCPKVNCESNYLKITQRVEKISLTDEETNQRVYLHKGDTIELTWSSEHGTAYHIEEKKYCSKSGGLYTPESTSGRVLLKGTYRNTFHEFGMFFLFRLTDTNQIQDITVCVINDKYQTKHIKITDHNIQPSIIWIEQYNMIIFEWQTTSEITLGQIEPFHIDERPQQSIELRNENKHFFWPYEPTRRGYMCHQFNETGVYCYKTGNDQIGTIIVEPQKSIHQVTIFSDQLIHKMKTTDLVQFNWKKSDSQEEPILITIDSDSSKVSDPPDHRTGIFDFSCCMHKCSKIEPFFRHCFHRCETFLLNIPQHGLYNFAYSNNRENSLISLIVENGIHTHEVIYDEKNVFKPQTIKINCLDQVQFRSSPERRASSIYQTDEYGNRLDSDKILFQPQQNSINYFLKQFCQSGIYYFSMDIKNHGQNKPKQSSTCPLAIIVLPEICLHRKLVGKGIFDSQIIITRNTNDFIIWEFEQSISYDVIRLHSNETFTNLISSHDRAILGKKRRCLAVNCKSLSVGASFFCNPDFERVTGIYQDRLISTILIDPLFSQNSFIVKNREFVPNILYIQENDTVSWILVDKKPNDRIYVHSNNTENEEDENILINRDIAKYVDGVDHLHTFNQPGTYIITSNRFPDPATVVVYSTSAIKSENKQIQSPQIVEDIDPVSQFDTQIHLDYPNHRNADIYYTLNGSSPKRRDNNVHRYDRNEGVHFRKSGLHLLRAYATEDQKLSSSIIASSPTFVMGNEEDEPSCSTDLTDIVQNTTMPPEDHIPDANKFSLNRLTIAIEIEAGIRRGRRDDEDVDSSDDSKDRARMLLKRLRKAIENRSKDLNSTPIHPHKSYPGIPHYINNQLLPQSSSIPSDD